ncbi:MAG: 50S ribosomal protein L11 [Candidatus Methanofastidiosa archaeon]|nr:50S ribosomal protein L11 [Candidatus Methanofastidiosa archaeon]
MAQSVKTLVDGGKASAGPPLGPALGPLGVPVPKVVQAINEKTKDFIGMKVPVTITVDDKRNFEIEVGTPPTAALLKKELKIEKGPRTPGAECAGNLSFEQIVKIANMKKDSLLSYDMKNAVKEVLGSGVPLNITVDDKPIKQVQKEIDEGKYAEYL